jgi:hypothetical protein
MYISYTFTPLALDGGDRSVSHPGHVLPDERTPSTHCTGGWVGPRAGLDSQVRGKISCLCQGSNIDHPVVQSVARHYADWAARLKIFKWILEKSHVRVWTGCKGIMTWSSSRCIWKYWQIFGFNKTRAFIWQMIKISTACGRPYIFIYFRIVRISPTLAWVCVST